MASEFKKALEKLLNIHSMENRSNTPDFILAAYLKACLDAFDAATIHRTSWHEMDKNQSDAPDEGAATKGL